MEDKIMDYISSQKIKSMFKTLPFTVKTHNIDINGQKRGCSGFIINNNTNKICYITTEPYFDGGLFGNKNQTIMMRQAKSLSDYTGGTNKWLSVNDIIKTAKCLTA